VTGANRTGRLANRGRATRRDASNRRHGLPIHYDREVLEPDVKISYDTDTHTVVLKDTPVAESDEDRPGVIFDFDEEGEIVGVEILDASRRVTDPRNVEFPAVA
jgi:uncharacterized protein YuzE